MSKIRFLGYRLVGLGVASVGFIINMIYYNFEFYQYGIGGFRQHFIDKLPEHILILTLMIIFPTIGYLINLYLYQRNLYEKKLEEQAEFIAGILNTVDIAILTLNRNYRVDGMNRAGEQLLGMKEEEVKGLLGENLFSNREDFWKIIDGVWKSGKYEGEHTIKSRNGEIPCYVNVRPFKSTKGRVYIFVMRDIRAEKEKEELKERIFQAEKLASIGKLAAGVAHEVNNPLTSASLITERLIEKYADNLELVEKLEKVKAKLDTASKIAREILNIYRDTKIEFREIALEDVINEAIESIEVPDNVSIDVNTAGIKIFADPSHMRRLFNNLLLNSIQAMPEGGKISITATEEDDSVVIKFSDTGTGIPEDIIDRIFDPFFTTKEVGEGTGLGLSIVHSIVKGHGGYIEVDSKPGEGTTFTITLPKKIEPQ